MEMSATYLVKQRMIEQETLPWKVNLVDMHLQYWPKDNLITDELGNVIYNVFDIVSWNDLALFHDNPYRNAYFLHVSEPDTIVGISYKDPAYYEEGDYKRYPTKGMQRLLRDAELERFDDRLNCNLTNFEYRRKIYPELYVGEES